VCDTAATKEGRQSARFEGGTDVFDQQFRAGLVGRRSGSIVRLVALTDRDDDETDQAGRYISLIDVDKAIAKSPDAEIRRVLVGIDDAQGESHPFSLAFTPDGSRILVANDLAANLSVVDVKQAVAGDKQPEVARIPLPLPQGSGNRPRPRVVAATPDGHYAVVGGGEPNIKAGGMVWVVDLQQNKVVGTVTGVGNEPCLMAITDQP